MRARAGVPAGASRRAISTPRSAAAAAPGRRQRADQHAREGHRGATHPINAESSRSGSCASEHRSTKAGRVGFLGQQMNDDVERAFGPLRQVLAAHIGAAAGCGSAGHNRPNPPGARRSPPTGTTSWSPNASSISSKVTAGRPASGTRTRRCPLAMGHVRHAAPVGAGRCSPGGARYHWRRSAPVRRLRCAAPRLPGSGGGRPACRGLGSSPARRWTSARRSVDFGVRRLRPGIRAACRRSAVPSPPSSSASQAACNSADASSGVPATRAAQRRKGVLSALVGLALDHRLAPSGSKATSGAKARQPRAAHQPSPQRGAGGFAGPAIQVGRALWRRVLGTAAGRGCRTGSRGHARRLLPHQHPVHHERGQPAGHEVAPQAPPRRTRARPIAGTVSGPPPRRRSG